MNNSQMLTVEQVARQLQVSYWTVLEYIRDKDLPYMKVGPRYRVPQDELDKWVKERMSNG